jgi:hypothetical protein
MLPARLVRVRVTKQKQKRRLSAEGGVQDNYQSFAEESSVRFESGSSGNPAWILALRFQRERVQFEKVELVLFVAVFQ